MYQEPPKAVSQAWSLNSGLGCSCRRRHQITSWQRSMQQRTKPSVHDGFRKRWTRWVRPLGQVHQKSLGNSSPLKPQNGPMSFGLRTLAQIDYALDGSVL